MLSWCGCCLLMSVSSPACSSLGSDRAVVTLVPHGKAGVFTLPFYKCELLPLTSIARRLASLRQGLPSRVTSVSLQRLDQHRPAQAQVHKLDKADATGLDPMQEADSQCLKSQYGSSQVLQTTSFLNLDNSCLYRGENIVVPDRG